MTSPAWLERARANVRAAAEGREEPFPMLTYACPHCGKLFDAPQAVGGHVAQAHGKHAAAPRPGSAR
jgi:hypothetical protein